TRNAAAGIAAPAILGMVMQLLGTVGGVAGLRPVLLSTPYEAWHGLLAAPSFTGPLVQGLIVSAVWAVACLAASFVHVRRRDVPDVGPGSDWVCLMGWTDPNVPMPPEGYGKFEITVHNNDCYTAGGPSKLVGFQTITDQHGRDVNNPVFEFDGCFDPGADNAP